MSGLEAIGAAAAILQLVDFGSRLLVTSYDIYKSQTGAAPDAIHIENVCTELKEISAHLSQPPANNVPLNAREQASWHLANRVHDLADDLGLLLDSLKLKTSTFKPWGSLRQSWRNLRQKDKIAKMTSELSDIRSLLDTNLLVLLR